MTTSNTEFQALTVGGGSKKQNDLRTITVGLFRDGKFVANQTVTKRSPSDKALTQEVVFWASKLGFQAGQAVAAEGAKTEAATGTEGKASNVTQMKKK